MDDEITIIHQNPLSMSRAFHAERSQPLVSELLFNVLIQGSILSGRTAVHDDKKFRERGRVPQIQDADVLSLLVQAGFNGGSDGGRKISLAETPDPWVVLLCLDFDLPPYPRPGFPSRSFRENLGDLIFRGFGSL